MKRIFVILLTFVLLLGICPMSALAETGGSGNVDGGGGDMGQGTSQNSWNPGMDGVRITVVDAESGQPVSSSFDLTNKTPSIKIHFGKVSKIQYANGASISPTTGNYDYYTPATPMPRIVSSGSQKASIDASKVKSLYVTAEAGEIRIQPSSDEKIWISGLDPSLYVADMDLDTKELTISRSDSSVDSEKTLLIRIPQDKVFEELYLNSSAGSLETEGKLAAKICDMDVAAGNLEVELMEADDSTLNCNAGRMKIKFTGKLNDYAADVSVNTGALELDGESIDGFHEGTFGAESSDKTMDIDNNAGNIRIDFENQ